MRARKGPPAYIWSALDVLKVERIDHGVRCTEGPGPDGAPGARAHPADGVPAVQRQAVRVSRPGEHNLRQLLDAGLCVTVNSDDPAYFGGYMNQNFLQTFAALHLSTQARLAHWRHNSFAGQFCPSSRPL
jgi:adenosine deaminase